MVVVIVVVRIASWRRSTTVIGLVEVEGLSIFIA